jgi:lactoylglutathione lyase
VIARVFPILSTPELRRALAFYVDALGGTVSYRFPETGEPEYVTVRIGASSLGLAAHSRVKAGAPEEERFELGAYTRDVDAVVARLRKLGVRVIDEPKDQPWGERMARVLDPDGNCVTLFEGE